MLKRQVDHIIHVGDLSYSDDHVAHGGIGSWSDEEVYPGI